MDDAHVPTAPYAFFISHHHEDRARATALHDALIASGASTFLDASSIASGVRWSEPLREALTTCRCFVVLLTPDRRPSPHVAHEINVAVERARDSGDVRVVPVWLASKPPAKKAWPAPLSIYQGPCWPVTETAAAFITRALSETSGPARELAPVLDLYDDVLAAAWRVARSTLSDAAGPGSLFALVGDLLAAVGLREAAREATPPTWRGRLGDDPERWAVVVPRRPSDLRAARTLAGHFAHEILAIADVDGLAVDASAVVLTADPGGFGLCDLLAAAASTFWAFGGLAAALARRGVTEQRLAEAAADRVTTRGRFIEQAWRHAPDARRYARLRAITARTRAAFADIREYRGVDVTLPRRQVDDWLERLVAGELRSVGSGAPVVALVGAQGIGKTSALCSFIERHPHVPAVFVQARRIDAHFRDRRWRLDDELDVPALVREIDRYRTQRPHLLLCVDGLNEGDPAEVARALDSPATEALRSAGVAIAVSCWPAHWRDRFRRLCGEVVEVALDEFSDEELTQALALRGHARDAIPPSLWPLARRPALLDHVLRLGKHLGRDGPVSRMDIFWADLQFKAERRWIDAPGDGSALKAHLVALIQNYQARMREAPERAGARAAELARWPGGSPWQDAPDKLLTLEDFDVIRVDREGKISLADESIAIAVMGLLLCEEMHLLRDDLGARLVRGRKFLDEIADLIEPSEATLQALGFSLGHDDTGRTLALLVLLLDNRNFEPERLGQFGHRLVADALTITRFEIADELLENGTVCRTRAEDLVVEHADERDLPWITALLGSDRPDDASLVHGLVDLRQWPALLDPLHRALMARRERGGRVDDVGFELLSALVEGYDVTLIELLVRELTAARSSRRRPPAGLVQLADALHAPELLEPLLALADRHPRSAARILRSLPSVHFDGIEARLRPWLVRDPRTAVGIFEWAVSVDSPLALHALRAGGEAILDHASDDDMVALALGAARLGWSRRLATWAVHVRAPTAAPSRARLGLLLAHVAATADMPSDLAVASLRRARRLGLPLDSDLVGSFHDLPLDPDRRLRAVGLLAAVTDAEADEWLRAEVCPDRVSSQLADEFRGTESAETATRLLDDHVHLLLPGTRLRPDDVLPVVDRAPYGTSGHLAQAALQFLCFYDLPGAIAMSLRIDTAALDPGVLSLLPLAGEVADHLVACLRARPSLRAVATVLAMWARIRGPLPAEIDRWIGKALGIFDGAALACVVDLATGTSHRGLGGAARRLCDDGVLSIDRQWDLCASAAVTDPVLLEGLLRRAAGPAELVALDRLARRRMPGAERWLAARLRATVESTGPHVSDVASTTRLADLLAALVQHDIPPDDSTVEALLDRPLPDNSGVRRGVVTWVARWRPARLPELLKAVGKQRSSSGLEYAAGQVVSVMPPGTRGEVFAALCFDREPSETAPRPDLGDEDDARFHAFVGLARHPPTVAELDRASLSVNRRWRSNLAHLAVFSDDGGAWLTRMAADEPSGAPRAAARHAQLRRAQRTQISTMLRRLAADPQGTLRSPLAIHLALRLDGTHQPEVDLLMQGPFEVRRALAWILRAARHRPSDWILTP